MRRYHVKIDDLKSLTWIIDDIAHQNQEIAINSKSNYDYKVDCNSPLEKD